MTIDQAAFPSASAMPIGPLASMVAARRAELITQRRTLTVGWERRRRNTERALHDGLQQHLLALRIDLLRAANPANPANGSALAGVREQAITRIDRVMEELHRLAAGEHPSVLDRNDLTEAIRELSARAALPVTVIARPGIVADGATSEMLVFVASETLANASRYGHPTAVVIRLLAATSFISLHIEDDGIGGATIVPGRGLAGLRTRAEALGGSLTIDSRPGRTSVAVVVPRAASSAPLDAAAPGPSCSSDPVTPDDPRTIIGTESPSKDRAQLVGALLHMDIEERRFETRASIFEVSLRSRLTNAPRNELLAARSVLAYSGDQRQERELMVEAAGHIEAANNRLREIVGHLRSPHDLAAEHASVSTIEGSLYAIAAREQVTLEMRLDPVDDPAFAHCVERIVEELLLDADRGSTVTLNLRAGREVIAATITTNRLVSPMTAAFVDELLFAVGGHWTVRPSTNGVRLRVELPCES